MRIDNRVATVTGELTNGLARLLPRKVTNSRIRSTQSFDDLVEHGELILKCVIVIVLQRVELVESRWAHVERATNLTIHHLHLRRRQGAPPELISTVQRLSGVQRKLSVILLLARLARCGFLKLYFICIDAALGNRLDILLFEGVLLGKFTL